MLCKAGLDQKWCVWAVESRREVWRRAIQEECEEGLHLIRVVHVTSALTVSTPIVMWRQFGLIGLRTALFVIHRAQRVTLNFLPSMTITLNLARVIKATNTMDTAG